jgi:large subunit ribosomal protein L21
MVPGESVVIDHLGADKGAEVNFDQVLVVEKDGGELTAGAPFVAGAKVVAVVDGTTRGPKIRVFKKKKRKGMRRTKGHRSTYTRVTVKSIVF